MTYLIVVRVPYYRVGPTTIAVQSAFARHLTLLKEELTPKFNKIIVASTPMSKVDYECYGHQLYHHDEEQENIYFTTADVAPHCKSSFFFCLFYSIPQLIYTYKMVRKSGFVHSGLSIPVWRPIQQFYVICSILLRKKSLFVADIDFRNSEKMLYTQGELSLKSHLLWKYIYDPLRSLQVIIACRFCSLVLLKGQEMCDHYGKGRENVKNFIDAAHSKEHIIGPKKLEAKKAILSSGQGPLELVYFGRLVQYKGIDLCLEAIAIAQSLTKKEIRFNIVGGGNLESHLKQKTMELNLGDSVIFHGSMPFGDAFFEMLHNYHLLLAAPRKEDTPRSVLDAMAAGIPVLAFDTYYYRDLECTGAVATVPWPSVEALARKIADFAEDKEPLVQMSAKGVLFARDNTQEIWLRKRLEWTLDIC